MSITTWRRLRRLVQVVSLVVFLAMIVALGSAGRLHSRPILLMRLDPLAALVSILAARRWIVTFVPAIILLLAALGLGRFWCGWLCPLGTLIDWISPRKVNPLKASPSHWRGLKYGLLFTILFLALWGNLTLLFLDPLTVLVRGVGAVILPGLTWLVTAAELALYRVPFLRGALDVVDGALRGRVIEYVQPFSAGAIGITALFGGALALNWTARRGWCRYVCPLGGLFALVSKASWLKRVVSSDCVNCGACARDCRMGTIDPKKGYASDSGECILCLDCAVDCPKQAISFGSNWRMDRGWGYDPNRRQALAALGASLGGLALLKIAPSAHHPYSHRLRPPAADEESLLAACVRCGACLRVCPTHGLQPSLTESGVEGLWTPILTPRLGPCEYTCTACGQVCPTGAIPKVTPATKWAAPIGKAYVNPSLCIPWSGRGECIVCEEMCPLPDKAIKLQEVEIVASDGSTRQAQAPVVIHDACIGCGLCESKCPINGAAAIRVMIDPMS